HRPIVRNDGSCRKSSRVAASPRTCLPAMNSMGGSHGQSRYRGLGRDGATGNLIRGELPAKRTRAVSRTRLSLLYLGSYLFIIGIGSLLVPGSTLKILQSNADYGDVFPRVAGMLMSGLGLSIFGMIRARTSQLYPATLLMRVYFIVCIVAFYVMTADPMFLVLL